MSMIVGETRVKQIAHRSRCNARLFRVQQVVCPDGTFITWPGLYESVDSAQRAIDNENLNAENRKRRENFAKHGRG